MNIKVINAVSESSFFKIWISKVNIKESNRLLNLCQFEDSLYAQGFEMIAGVDEVGRGSLAGPIVAAAVVLKRKGIFIEGIDDSKKITYKKRKNLFGKIIANCVCYSVAKMCSKKIDSISLGKANAAVLVRAIDNLKVTPQIVLSDAFPIASPVPVFPIINGDELSVSIAAASIVAKVIRDEIMEKFASIYPAYGFDENKGYATRNHILNLKKYGPCPIHRLSFNGVLTKQESFF